MPSLGVERLEGQGWREGEEHGGRPDVGPLSVLHPGPFLLSGRAFQGCLSDDPVPRAVSGLQDASSRVTPHSRLEVEAAILTFQLK